jgi:CHRD domain
MRRIRRAVVGSAVAIATITVGGTAPVSADHTYRAAATIMTGANEVPGPGDADGVGVAGVLVNVRLARVCYALAVKNIEPATAAHIHRGPVGVAGPVVVPLDPPTRGFSANCTTVDPTLAGEIAHSPDQFYVNVHNATFPAGAIRGQLG